MNRKKHLRGITLVDLMIGLVLITVIMLGAFVSLRQLGMGRAVNSLSNRVDNKLRTVAEQIRYDSATGKYATWDQVEPNRDWTNDFDAAIKVTSHVDAENTDTRSRKVTLTATWIDVKGMARSRVQVLYVTRTRAKTQPGAAYIRVVERDRPNVGIPGVRVWVQGQRGMWPPAGQPTDATGLATIPEVMLGTNLPVTVDGQGVRAFFMFADNWKTDFKTGITSPNTSALLLKDRTWRREDFRISEIKLGALDNHDFDDGGLYGPIRMTPPGHLTGHVKNWQSDSPVAAPAGLEVRLYLTYDALGIPRADMPYTPSAGELKTTTKADGSYEFDNLVPGHYFPLLVGNDHWAAQVRLGDADFPLNGANPDLMDIPSFGTTGSVSQVRDFVTAPRGSVNALVTRVGYNAGIYSITGPVSSGVNVTCYRQNAIGYHDPSIMPGFLPMDFTTTAAWQYVFSDIANNNIQTTDKQDHDYSWPNITSWMVNGDIGHYSMREQFNWVRIAPSYTDIGSNLTPIRVYGLGSPSPQFLLVDSQGFTMTAPAGAVVNDADINIHVGETKTKTINLLDRSALARVTGTIMMGASAFTTPGQIYVPFGGGAFGALQYTGSPDFAYLGYFTKPTTIVPGAPTPTQTFDTSFSAALVKNLPPNIGADTTRIYFEARSAGVQVDRLFAGQVIGTMQVRDANGLNPHSEFVAEDLVNAHMPINAFTYKGLETAGQHLWDTDVEVYHGHLGASGGGFHANIEQFDLYSGNTGPLALAPGQTVNNAVISVVQSAADSGPLWLNFGGYSLGDNQQWFGRRDLPPKGTVYHAVGTTYEMDGSISWNAPLAIQHSILYHVSGKVTASGSDTGLQGVHVILQEVLGASREAVTDSTGHYEFPDKYLIPLFQPTYDMVLRVPAATTVGTTIFDPSAEKRIPLSDPGPGNGAVDVNCDFQLLSGGGSDGTGGQ